jgi:four helix bundle protein
MRTFEELIVWQKARVLCRDVFTIAGSGPLGREFGLRDQICRASLSVMSNIAEGFGRYGRTEFRRFLVIARGSLYEVRSQLYVALDLGLIAPEVHARLIAQCAEVERLLAGLRNSLAPDPRG